MKAAYIERTGPAREVLQVGEIADPTPGEGEVLVRVRVAGINPSDVKSRAGANARTIDGRVVIHNDGAGEIVAVGRGVDEGRIGERVWLHNTRYARPLGTAAELVAAPAADAEPLLDGYGFEEGACFGVPLLTAYHGVLVAGPVEGHTVLVTGGAGAVGLYAIQVAKRKGATVIASVSSNAKAEVARAAGADHTVDYRAGDLVAEVAELTAGRGADHYVEVNLSVNGPTMPHLVASGGSVAVYGSDEARTTFDASVLRRKLATMHFYNVYVLPPAVLRAAKDDLARLLRSDPITTLVDERFTLERIVDAHEAVESGRLVGNAVIDVA